MYPGLLGEGPRVPRGGPGAGAGARDHNVYYCHYW